MEIGDTSVSFDELLAQAEKGKVFAVHQTFGGTLELDLTSVAPDRAAANPRFVVVQHYRLSSHFGDYGAGKTVGVFTLMPGEETRLYLRSWRRTEEKYKAASSIFDSFTAEAANEFESDIQSETTEKESQSVARELHSQFKGSGGVNLGFLKTDLSGEASDDVTTNSANESIAKSAHKVSTHHSSKASSKRETEVTQELEKTAEQEFETITERTIKNTNLSRTLNIVTRELNQEFKTYFSLVDVSLAFKNDRGVVEHFQIHEIDKMLRKYLKSRPPEPPAPGAGLAVGGVAGGLATPSPDFDNMSQYSWVRRTLLENINAVYDFQGTRHELLEEVVTDGDSEEAFPLGRAPSGSKRYIRVRRARGADARNPFYEEGFVPVEGLVMNVSNHTVRTGTVIIDSLLGHGVALDNYALGMQQEALRKEQNENRKTEVALDLVASGDEARITAFKDLLGSPGEEFLRQVVLGEPEEG